MNRSEELSTKIYILGNLDEIGGRLRNYNPHQDPTGLELREVANAVRSRLKRARDVMGLKSLSFHSTRSPTTELEDKVLWGLAQAHEQQLTDMEAQHPSIGTAGATKPHFGPFTPQTSLKQL